jgi:hypothetical protein
MIYVRLCYSHNAFGQLLVVSLNFFYVLYLSQCKNDANVRFRQNLYANIIILLIDGYTCAFDLLAQDGGLFFHSLFVAEILLRDCCSAAAACRASIERRKLKPRSRFSDDRLRITELTLSARRSRPVGFGNA